ncbi:Microtubule-associated protein TORTIFOLIA1 [Hibiscus syriacus]|uniref:Microtubule-associated protein TORTIFOLIA1 n=1 Tax=Hibiscus syriacus TaxID=106335 RepID=A0A6A3B9W6_HIBSY|nr:microtubule-associated protein TORTIFOLIA1-like [Hibiscus syriacus]KAE8713676.1 Microtubule-associated protein TORTIFOLIA1 [Hibiscus syriacus]
MSNPQASKSTKPSKSSTLAPSKPSSLSSHLAMVELKQRILTLLSKLSDRDTYQIAVEDLEKIIQSISPESLPMLLNCLFDSSNDSKPAVKKESLRLLSTLCNCHGELAASHLTKIIAHIVKRLKDADSGVKDACRDSIGALSGKYLKGENGGTLVGLFVKPLFEAMGEQNKGVQSGAAICMANMVKCAADPPLAAFQKLCPRICKLLNSQNFMAKASLLPVVASLSQVGAVAPQSMEALLQSIHECLGSTDWATRKAAADTLSALALHSSNLIADRASLMITVLEGCRFDRMKPVRDAMTEALQLWKKIAGEGDAAAADDQKSHDGDDTQSAESSQKSGLKNPNVCDKRTDPSGKDSSNNLSPTSDSVSQGKGGSIPDKAVVFLKKKAPVLTDKELNPEFFQKLETRGSGDVPVEVVVPRRHLNSSNSKNEEESKPDDPDMRRRSNCMGNSQADDFCASSGSKNCNIKRGAAGVSDKWPEEKINGKDLRTRAFDANNRIDVNQREQSGNRLGYSKVDGQSEESFISNKGNWLAIQRQLLQLERKQGHLMNMLQDFMGGSHDSMVTLENRVRGLERIVEDMARDLSLSSGRRGGNFMEGFEGSSNRSLGKYNGFSDYGSKFSGRVPYGERFAQSDGIAPGGRGRGPFWRSEMSDDWDFPAFGALRNGQIPSRRAPASSSGLDGRSPKSEHESDQVGGRRGWDKGPGPKRLGEGPSARSVWQASKDEATLEAIRVAGEDSGACRTGRVPELTAEALGDDDVGPERDPVWISWSNAMHALQVGDMDSAYAEVLSTGDDLLLIKLMDKSGPMVDQLSNEIANEAFHAILQFLLEPDLFDICLSWIQQLVEVVLENGPDAFGIPMELKKELLLNLHEAASTTNPPEDWEGIAPDQLLLQLASAWGIELQKFDK